MEDDLPMPLKIMDQYDAGEIDVATLAYQTLHHVAILYAIKDINREVINGLLDDVAMLAAYQQVERPSTASRERLKILRRPAREAAAAENGGLSTGEAVDSAAEDQPPETP